MRFPWQKRKEFFSFDEKQQLIEAIQSAEQRTSGEIRLFIEARCRFMNPVDRAEEVFFMLGMERTELRNGTLIYVATKDHQTAVYGDSGIHQKVGAGYWRQTVDSMIREFRQEHLTDGICAGVAKLGEALAYYFPYNRDTDKNELPDDIVFGR